MRRRSDPITQEQIKFARQSLESSRKLITQMRESGKYPETDWRYQWLREETEVWSKTLVRLLEESTKNPQK